MTDALGVLFWTVQAWVLLGNLVFCALAWLMNRRAARMVRRSLATWQEARAALVALEDAMTRALQLCDPDTFEATRTAVRQASAAVERASQRYRE